jgi:hypothetical protein
MTDDLLLEYENTRYQVLTVDGELVAEAVIGRSSDQIDQLLADHDATSGVFITAWNPRSEITDAEQNRQANRRMRAELVDAGMIPLPHRGVGVDPSWEPEEGFFVVGMTEDDAVPVAEAYGQFGFVVVPRGDVARLVLTRVMRDATPGTSPG